LTTIESNPNAFAVLTHVARDIKLSHTVFALPFALLATFLASSWDGRLPGWPAFVLILLCMFFARTVAMAVNRWADAGIDALNPRTAGRAVPSGRVSRGAVLSVAVLCAVCFILSAAGFWWLDGNTLPVLLSPLVLVVLCLYSYAKRFTWACHLILGFALAISPLAAVVAIEPGYLTQPTIWLLAAMVLCWVAGFDVIYALQDVEADKSQGLFSMPSRLGTEPALWVSRALHFSTIGFLVTAVSINPILGSLFAGAVALTALLLVIEHALVWRSETNHISMAFFTVNGIISILLGLAGTIECLAVVD